MLIKCFLHVAAVCQRLLWLKAVGLTLCWRRTLTLTHFAGSLSESGVWVSGENWGETGERVLIENVEAAVGRVCSAFFAGLVVVVRRQQRLIVLMK